MGLTEKIKGNPAIKSFVLWMMMPRNQARPRLWVRLLLNPLKHHRGSHSKICRTVRNDLMPFREFSIGENSTVEDFATLNNGVGALFIGSNTRIGIGSVLIGPVTIGNDVRLAQNVVCSGLNHSYQDISTPIWRQAVTTSPITVGDETWIGSNAVIVAGVSIGKHCVIAAGSVITKSIPDYTVAAGNPAQIIKQYNPKTQTWERSNK